MKVRRIPFDPPWLIVPYLGGTVLGAAVISNGGSILLLWSVMAVAITCGIIGVDRWYEHRHKGRVR
jgi:hypothetical protein